MVLRLPSVLHSSEMLNDPAGSNGCAADVYSLAKVLWTLLTGQRYPPPGPHRLDEPGTSLTRWIDYDRSPELDHLLARATTYEPDARLSMSKFAEELLMTIDRPSSNDSVRLDRTSLVNSIAARLEPGARAVEEAGAYLRRVNDILDQLRNEAVSPAYNELVTAVPHLLGISLGDGSLAHTFLPSVRAIHRQLGWDGVVTTQGLPHPISATFAAGVRSSEDGTATIIGVVVVTEAIDERLRRRNS
jgi:hypothetical protein